MNLITEHYIEQVKRWPKSGRQIIAQYDNKSIIVYQAYYQHIADYAINHGYFGGEFKLNRMSWIKPNFLWMMYRSGWGRKKGQEVILAIKLKKNAFDYILENAVHSSYIPELYSTRENWKLLSKNLEVRLQWDPDHDPLGNKSKRRAIQLGLKGEILKKFSKDWIIDIENISDFVLKQRENLKYNKLNELITPMEKLYKVENPEVARKLGIT